MKQEEWIFAWGELLEISRFGALQNLGVFKDSNGSRVLFWQDVCCGDSPLKTQFPDLSRMGHSKDEWFNK